MAFNFLNKACFPGCHVLALDLVCSWSFERPTTAIREPRPPTDKSRDIIAPIPSHYPLGSGLRRKSSILIDMEITSLPPTRKTSPDASSLPKAHPIDTIQEESDLFARQAGLGKLMKSAKHDVQVPEFDMNAFF